MVEDNDDLYEAFLRRLERAQGLPEPDAVNAGDNDADVGGVSVARRRERVATSVALDVVPEDELFEAIVGKLEKMGGSAGDSPSGALATTGAPAGSTPAHTDDANLYFNILQTLERANEASGKPAVPAVRSNDRAKSVALDAVPDEDLYAVLLDKLGKAGGSDASGPTGTDPGEATAADPGPVPNGSDSLYDDFLDDLLGGGDHGGSVEELPQSNPTGGGGGLPVLAAAADGAVEHVDQTGIEINDFLGALARQPSVSIPSTNGPKASKANAEPGRPPVSK